MKAILFILLFVTQLCAKEKIELFTCFYVGPSPLSEVVADAGLDVVNTSLDIYKKALKKKRPRPLSLCEDTTKFVFWNLTKHECGYRLDRFPKEKMVLFMWEPPTVLPKMYLKRVQKCFSRIYTWNDDLVDNKTYFKFNYPVLVPMIDELVPFNEKKLLTIVCGFHSSTYPTELYSRREKAIEYFEKQIPNDFDFYGKGWETTSKSYRGPSQDKIGTIKNYRFSICFENTEKIPGYITEKIFDCFAAGNVPIYLGASNVQEFIPKECFIDMRGFKSFDALYKYISTMDEREYQGYIENIKRFLKSEKAQAFSYETFKKVFYEATTFRFEK